jgi:hypothetical protein
MFSLTIRRVARNSVAILFLISVLTQTKLLAQGTQAVTPVTGTSIICEFKWATDWNNNQRCYKHCLPRSLGYWRCHRRNMESQADHGQ